MLNICEGPASRTQEFSKVSEKTNHPIKKRAKDSRVGELAQSRADTRRCGHARRGPKPGGDPCPAERATGPVLPGGRGLRPWAWLGAETGITGLETSHSSSKLDTRLRAHRHLTPGCAHGAGVHTETTGRRAHGTLWGPTRKPPPLRFAQGHTPLSVLWPHRPYVKALSGVCLSPTLPGSKLPKFCSARGSRA